MAALALVMAALALRRVAGAYLVVLAVVVAVYFIINPFLPESFEVLDVWYVLDVLMAVALAVALVVNFAGMQEEGKRDPDGAVTRRYLEINVAFYVTAGVAVLFLHNWFSLLALGGDSLEGNHQAWVIWAVVDVVLPLVVGVTGCRLWREASRP